MSTLTDRLRHGVYRTFVRGVVCTLVAATVGVFALPSAAMAEDNYYKTCEYDYVSCQTGVAVGLPQGECMTTTLAYAYTSICVDYDGDYVYVRDGKADGYAAMGYVGSANGVSDRLCRNNHGYGTWVRCNFDWVEAGAHSASAGYKEQFYIMELDYLWSWSGK
ncbi:hypothetical protein GCM10010169_36300 [Micromonospora fulviviridis]|uniref:hypothetical protein n=1 Tax=Micromonospora fulviviridis TaxID=47860 RepID=UPI001665803F|nr:hypothetical protein [Micromonospora fulviviridis]GGR88775.1 hypothetical protein GCM10010169_36300 [Micromonospora fulviviridis]